MIYTLFFANAHAGPGPLAKVDAILVLGGEHDGREAHGLKSAEQGYAPVVLMSDLYGPGDVVMKRFCRRQAEDEVICRPPVPNTTRGEALMARALAEQRGWRSVIVISWRYHLAPRPADLRPLLRAAQPHRHYARRAPHLPVSAAQWRYTFLYLYGGWVKAEVQGGCD